MKKDYAIYQVALKVLLRKNGKVLFLKTADGKRWDLPGGRIDNVENNIQLKKILFREIHEELGNKVKYILSKPVFQYRRFIQPSDHPIFLTVYEAKYLSGDINISFEHSGYEWLDVKKHNFKKTDFYGKEEYLAFKDYLDFK